MMNHGFDPRQLFSFRSIDVDDLRVGKRAAQNARVEHPRKLNIAGVLGLAGYPLVGVDARSSFADNRKFLLSVLPWRPPLARFVAAARTAATSRL